MRLHVVAIAITVFAALPVQAQTLRGVVRDAETRRPLVGAFVTLRDATGAMRVGALTDSLGRYFLQPPQPGAYAARAELIGYQSVTQDVVVSAAEGVEVNLALPVNAIRLREIAVTHSRSCTNDAGRARQAAAVWEEARKALAVAAWIDASAGARFWIRVGNQTLDLGRRPTAHPEWAFDSISGRRAFATAPADNLLDAGFVLMTNRDAMYYGPDAELLVSPRFSAEHCFSVERRNDRPGLIGLAFEPMSGSRVTGIRGALWLHEDTGELRFIDYEYVRMPVRVNRDHARGHVSVRQLPNGAFILDSYSMIMPFLERDPRTGVVRTSALRERTGQVLDLLLAGDTIQLVPRYTVRGTAYDSVAGRPIANVRLRLPGTPFDVVTDSTGAFVLRGVPSGTYAVEFNQPSLLNRPAPMPPVIRVDSADADVNVALPSRETLLRGLCPDDRTLSNAGRRMRRPPAELGVLQLNLLNPDGSPWLPHAEQVEVSLPASHDAPPLRAALWANGQGQVNACGLPIGLPLEIRFNHTGSSRRAATVTIPPDGFVRRTLVRN